VHNPSRSALLTWGDVRLLERRMMSKIEALMTQNPKCCAPNDTMNLAAQLMWENDCGSLPVVDESRRPIAMITDRDICMCAYIRGLPLAALPVSTAMSRTLVSLDGGISRHRRKAYAAASDPSVAEASRGEDNESGRSTSARADNTS
jgi:predicted transcriptional regulator